MVKITKENIEYFIFEYHEGNLSDTDKAEVLNFIHQHPEYENDFAHWAQSYFHTEGSVQNYGLTNQLLQKDAVSWYGNKWFAISGSVVVLVIGLYSYLLTFNPKTTSVTAPSLHSTSVKQSEKKETSISGAETNVNRTIQNTNHSSVTIDEAAQSLTPAATIENKTSAGIRMADTMFKTNKDYIPVSGIEDKPKSISKTDTIQHTTNVTQSNTQVKNKKNPAKNKSGVSLKPENKFIPTNPDF